MQKNILWSYKRINQTAAKASPFDGGATFLPQPDDTGIGT
jgi:hypothetical protein